MKISAILVLLCSLVASAAAQRPAPRTSQTPRPAPTQTTSAALESERWEAALAVSTPEARVEAIARFIEDFPNSRRIVSARESLSAARAAYADALLGSGEVERGIEQFRLAVSEAPNPFPQRLFDEVISRIPIDLVYRGRGQYGLEIADLIEEKANDSAQQLLFIASFHLGLENGSDAIRIAERALELEPGSSLALTTLALANRMNFDLGASAAAYRRVLDSEPDSFAAKRGLADALRGLGRTDEAIGLYRELLEEDENDPHAETGLILALFDAGETRSAEEALSESLERNPGNVILLSAAAYRYAAAGDGARAAELATSAIQIDPRFIWSHIALARGLMLQDRPVDAERALMAARRYGNFPSLDYEIASARMKAGFFREAAEELQRSFTVENGEIVTRLGGRIETRAYDFGKLLEGERLSSIFVPAIADDREDARRLKTLLELSLELAKFDADEARAAELADRFATGNGPMQIHRQLFAASALAEKRLAVDKVIELTRAATGNTDAGLSAANPSAAVMASELYETRRAAFAADQFLVVPEVPKTTLQSILRGRIEELTGWAFFHKGDLAAASTRLRRAISVLPKDSAWWRSSKWRLGEVFEAEGNDRDALDHYISGYDVSRPEIFKYMVIERVYRRVNGSDEGLEQMIGPNPLPPLIAAVVEEPPEEPTETVIEDPDVKDREKNEEEPETETSPVEPETPSAEEAESKTEDAEEAPDKAEDTEEEPVVEQEELEDTDDPKSDPQKEKVEDPKKDPEKEEVEKPSESKVEDPDDPTEVRSRKTEERADAEPEDEKRKDEEVEKGPDKQPADEKEEKEPVPESEPNDGKEAKTPEDPDRPVVDAVSGRTGEKPETKTEEKERSLFDPIIITVPSARPSRVGEAKEAPKPEIEKAPEDGEQDSPIARDATTKEQEYAGVRRTRVVAGVSPTESPEPCSISVSQENVTLVAGGGSIGLLVGIDNGNIEDIKAVSSSPNDVEVISDSDASIVSRRAFFVLTSISSKVGIFNITFDAPCGSKQLAVRVR